MYQDKLSDIDCQIIRTEEKLKELKKERKEVKKKLAAAEEQEVLTLIKELKISPAQAKSLLQQLANTEDDI